MISDKFYQIIHSRLVKDKLFNYTVGIALLLYQTDRAVSRYNSTDIWHMNKHRRMNVPHCYSICDFWRSFGLTRDIWEIYKFGKIKCLFRQMKIYLAMFQTVRSYESVNSVLSVYICNWFGLFFSFMLIISCGKWFDKNVSC